MRDSENAHRKFRKEKTGGSLTESPQLTKPHRSSALLTVREAAERLRVSSGWVYREIGAAKLGHVRVGGFGIRVPVEAIDEYLRHYPGLRTVMPPSIVPAPAEPRRRRVHQ